MTSFIKYVSAYLMWIIDLGLAFWLIFLARTVFVGLFAMSSRAGQLVYAHRVDFADKVFSILLGLGWLACMIILEAYFRAGVSSNDLIKRFAKVTGSVLLGIFGVDLILFWLQGVGRGDWLRWFMLAAELGIGITLLRLAGMQSKLNPT